MAKKNASFEDLLEELSVLLQQMESDEIDLDTAISNFEKGMELILKANEKLARYEEKIKIVLASSKGIIIKPVSEEELADEL
ncbi:MAG: exodeoxyribonuclease VII small subunit [Clostridia bacterium]